MWAVSLLDCLAHQKSYFCGKREEKKDGKVFLQEKLHLKK